MGKKKVDISVLAILTAAGKAERMGLKQGKALLRLNGIPCLQYSLRVLEEVKRVSEIVVVCPDGQQDRVRSEVIDRFGIEKVTRVLAGGATRQDSVRAALAYAKRRKPGLVLVHDAARPLLRPELVERAIEAAEKHGGAIVAVPVSETLKRGDGFVKRTLKRKNTWIAQTPQVFRFEELWHAHEEALRDGFAGTDDASLVERIGGEVAIVPGSRLNMKITYPEDIEIAEALLRCGSGSPGGKLG